MLLLPSIIGKMVVYTLGMVPWFRKDFSQHPLNCRGYSRSLGTAGTAGIPAGTVGSVAGTVALAFWPHKAMEKYRVLGSPKRKPRLFTNKHILKCRFWGGFMVCIYIYSVLYVYHIYLILHRTNISHLRKIFFKSAGGRGYGSSQESSLNSWGFDSHVRHLRDDEIESLRLT